MAPTIRSTGFPSRRTTSVGMLRALNSRESRGFSSTLTFTTLSRPVYSAASCSRIGETKRHGPHHGAHRSTTTETAARDSTGKVASVASTTHGSAAPQLPQNGVPRSLGRILFDFEQFGQVINVTGALGFCVASIAGKLSELGHGPKLGDAGIAFAQSLSLG